jgi:hypothetical protein
MNSTPAGSSAATICASTWLRTPYLAAGLLCLMRNVCPTRTLNYSGLHLMGAATLRPRLIALVSVVWLLLAPAWAAEPEPEPKCGVDMPHTTGSLSFDPTTIEESGVFLIEGGLYREGEVGTCLAVHVECLKKMNQCDMVEVAILKVGPYPEIGPITLADPMRVVAWTKDGLSAAGTYVCQRTELNVDFVHRKVQLVTTPRCPPGRPAVIEEVRTFPTFERNRP